MKHIKKALLLMLIFSILFMLSGCTTFLYSFQADKENVPVWVLKTPANSLSSLYFTSEGTDPQNNLAIAKQKASEKVLEKVSEYLGYDISEAYRREFYQTQKIADLKISVEDQFEKETAEGTSVYLLVEGDRKVISKLLRDNQEIIRAATADIVALGDKAAREYRRDSDYEAVSLYMVAAAAAKKSILADAEQRYLEYMSRATAIVKELSISIINANAGEGTATVEVVRGMGKFAPRIEQVQLRAVYPVKNMANKIRMDELSLVTGKKGVTEFSSSHPGFRGTGVVAFYLNFTDQIKTLEEQVGADNTSLLELKKAITSIKAEFPFQLQSQLTNGNIYTGLLEYASDGSLMAERAANDTLQKVLIEEGFTIIPLPLTGLDSEESIIQMAGKIRKERVSKESVSETALEEPAYLIVGTGGVTNITKSSSRFIVTVKGVFSLVEIPKGNEMYSTGQISANGSGADVAAARTAAFIRLGESVAASFLPALI